MAKSIAVKCGLWENVHIHMYMHMWIPYEFIIWNFYPTLWTNMYNIMYKSNMLIYCKCIISVCKHVRFKHLGTHLGWKSTLPNTNVHSSKPLIFIILHAYMNYYLWGNQINIRSQLSRFSHTTSNILVLMISSKPLHLLLSLSH